MRWCWGGTATLPTRWGELLSLQTRARNPSSCFTSPFARFVPPALTCVVVRAPARAQLGGRVGSERAHRRARRARQCVPGSQTHRLTDTQADRLTGCRNNPPRTDRATQKLQQRHSDTKTQRHRDTKTPRGHVSRRGSFKGASGTSAWTGPVLLWGGDNLGGT